MEARPVGNALGFVEYVHIVNVEQVETSIEERVLRLQLDSPRRANDDKLQPTGVPQGKAKVSVQALGNKLSINIEFPQDARLGLAPTDPFAHAAAASPASRRAGIAAVPASRLPVRSDDGPSIAGSDDTDKSQRGMEPAHDLSPSPVVAHVGSIPVRQSDTPLFERGISRSEASVEPIRYPVQRAGSDTNAMQFDAVAQSLAADHQAMAMTSSTREESEAMHKVSEDDARIKGRKQEARIQEEAVRHAKLGTTGAGIDLTRRKSLDRGRGQARRASIVQGEEADVTEMEDGEYTKDEELEHIKTWWRKIFRKDKSAPKSKAKSASKLREAEANEREQQAAAAANVREAQPAQAMPLAMPPAMPPLPEERRPERAMQANEIKKPEEQHVVAPEQVQPVAKEKKHHHHHHHYHKKGVVNEESHNSALA